MRKKSRSDATILGVSGGPDSVYLVLMEQKRGRPLVLAHFNHGARGADSDADQRFVEALGRAFGFSVEIGGARAGKSPRRVGKTGTGKPPPAGFEESARRERYAFFGDLLRRRGAGELLLAHTADDQVETVLMRIFEGAGISGLKGIPRNAAGGIARPLLDTWREDILDYLHARKIAYRIDKSNADVRFERNWIRRVLLPLLEKRYGKAVRKRIRAVGERLREVDEFLEQSARTFLKNNMSSAARMRGICTHRGSIALSRQGYSRRPAALRKKALQLTCFENLGIAPNERLLESMDRFIISARPSGCLSVGKGWTLTLRYGEAIFQALEGTDRRPGGRSGARTESGQGDEGTAFPGIRWDEREDRIPPSRARRMAAGERAAVFDADVVRTPLSVRPLRPGDRVRPFGMDVEKKVKEILIDRKVPRERRWGRPVVCDAAGEILWIPEVLRSSHAPVGRKTARTVVVRIETTAPNRMNAHK